VIFVQKWQFLMAYISVSGVSLVEDFLKRKFLFREELPKMEMCDGLYKQLKNSFEM